jgi:hypothetical protein
MWFRDRGKEFPVYCFHRVGPRPVTDAYHFLADHLGFDTVILVDGGTDSLMRGDEEGLGTARRRHDHIAAADALDDAKVPRKLLACLGFGIDTFHGVCHAHVLEAVADLARVGGYLGHSRSRGDARRAFVRGGDGVRYGKDVGPAKHRADVHPVGLGGPTSATTTAPTGPPEVNCSSIR